MTERCFNMRWSFAITGLVLVVSISKSAAAGESEITYGEQSTSEQVDALLTELLNSEGVTPAALTNDEDFLRRISLDFNGVVPSPKDVTVFGINPDPHKRAKVISSLLSKEQFGQFWGSYWREVIMSRATEQRARIVEPGLEKWFATQFNSDRPWDEIARSLITATGDINETGETGLIFAHTGQPEELAAEISRIFLGIQLSCANCHDHPTDSWKREDFHQLAAFLPRVSVRREDPQNPRSFVIRSLENNPRNRGFGAIDPEQLFRSLDRNRNGQVEKSESNGPFAGRFEQLLRVADSDKNGKLSKTEFGQIRNLANMQQPGRGELEYYMPDLNNPASKGDLTQPVFFIPGAKGPRLREGSDDLTRRHALSDFLTSPTNPWFAKAFVNRIWAEMLGQGFYMPLDDLGPERIAIFEPVLDLLAHEFVAQKYDVKWLFQTIANTDAYQRSVRAVPSDADTPPFAAAVPTRLSSDQIYQSLMQVLGTGPGLGGTLNGSRMGMFAQRAGLDPGKSLFEETFGIDPSTPKDEIIGNVPQGLFMMNSQQVESMVRGAGDTKLARILREQKNHEDALRELYLLVLSREPNDQELVITKQYLDSINQRTEGFEDIMWSLLNSTEFISKR